MSKSFSKHGFVVNIVNSKINIFNDNKSQEHQDPSFWFSLSMSEVDAFTRALGVIASTEEFPSLPDEITFSPFVFNPLPRGFDTYRNDTPYLIPLTFKYKDIDNLHTIIKESVEIIQNITNNTNTRPRY